MDNMQSNSRVKENQSGLVAETSNMSDDKVIDTLVIRRLDTSRIRKQMKEVYFNLVNKPTTSTLNRLLEGYPSKNAIEFAGCLVKRLPQSINPGQFVDNAIQVLKFMRDGYDSTGIPISSVNKHCHEVVANDLIFNDLPKIASAIFPQGFAEDVKNLCYEIRKKGLVFSEKQ